MLRWRIVSLAPPSSPFTCGKRGAEIKFEKKKKGTRTGSATPVLDEGGSHTEAGSAEMELRNI